MILRLFNSISVISGRRAGGNDTLIPKTAIVSKKIFFTFSPYKSLCDQICPWRKIWSRSIRGHDLNNLGSTPINNATY